MKKNIMIMLLLAVMLSASCIARADLIYIPPDTFYSEHEAECVETSRAYEAPSDTHYYDQPEGEPMGDIMEGEIQHICCIWNDEWGLQNWGYGWIKLSDFRRVYEEEDFERDHRFEIYNVSGEILINEGVAKCSLDIPSGVNSAIFRAAESLGVERCPIYMWTYPGSGIVVGSKGSFEENSSITISSVYLDKEGLLWGQYYDESFSAHFGILWVWICLSNPSDNTLPCTTPYYIDQDAVDAGGM